MPWSEESSARLTEVIRGLEQLEAEQRRGAGGARAAAIEAQLGELEAERQRLLQEMYAAFAARHG